MKPPSRHIQHALLYRVDCLIHKVRCKKSPLRDVCAPRRARFSFPKSVFGRAAYHRQWPERHGVKAHFKTGAKIDEYHFFC